MKDVVRNNREVAGVTLLFRTWRPTQDKTHNTKESFYERASDQQGTTLTFSSRF
jgi:hypothetical protein